MWAPLAFLVLLIATTDKVCVSRVRGLVAVLAQPSSASFPSVLWLFLGALLRVRFPGG